MAENKTYTSESFFKELSFWLWPSMPNDRIKEYTKAFEEFFSRGKLSGSSDEKLIKTIGEPHSLAQKLISDDASATSTPTLKLLITFFLLIAGGTFYFLDIASTASYAWAIYLGVYGLILPLGITILCGPSIFTHTQWNKGVIIRISCVAALSLLLAVLSILLPYSKALLGAFSVLALCVMLFIAVYMMKDGAVMLPTMLLASEILAITSAVKSVNLNYAGQEQFDVVFATTKWQLLPLLVELLLFCGMLMIGWQYLLYRKKVKEDQNTDSKKQ